MRPDVRAEWFANEIEDAKTRKELVRLARDLDDIGRLDERTQEVFIDEKAFRNMLSGRVSKDLEEMIVAAGRAEKNSRLRAQTRGMKKVPWAEVASRVDTFRDAAIVRVANGEPMERVAESVRNDVAPLASDPRFLEHLAAAAAPQDPTAEHHIPFFGQEMIECYAQKAGLLYWVAFGILLAAAAAHLLGLIIAGLLFFLGAVLHIPAVLAIKRCWDELHGKYW